MLLLAKLFRAPHTGRNLQIHERKRMKSIRVAPSPSGRNAPDRGYEHQRGGSERSYKRQRVGMQTVLRPAGRVCKMGCHSERSEESRPLLASFRIKIVPPFA
jgi:hypothetical protein